MQEKAYALHSAKGYRAMGCDAADRFRRKEVYTQPRVCDMAGD